MTVTLTDVQFEEIRTPLEAARTIAGHAMLGDADATLAAISGPMLQIQLTLKAVA